MNAAASTLAAAPQISSLSDATLPRSGRLVIHGSLFGSFSGSVQIDGQNAWTTTWTDGRIVAFVPETASLGVVGVQVTTEDGSSNVAALTVRAREQVGRVRWTFEADTDNLWFRPALAPDGTIYLHSSQGFIYALSPDGGLKWVTQVNWFPYAPPTAGPDGTLYVGSINTVFAISPQGQILWSFQDSGAIAVHTNPSIGPDGNLYAANDPGGPGLGAYALNAVGGFLWNNIGDPPMYENGGGGAEMRFGPSALGGEVDQFYVGMERDGDSRLYAISLSGMQRWAIPVGPFGNGAEPVIGSDGAVYSTDFIGAGLGWVIRAFHPADGAQLWLYDGDFISGVSELEIGPDDTLYYTADLSTLEALDAATQTLVWSRFTGDVLGRPTLSPDGTTIVLSGSADVGSAGFIKGYDSATGQQQWWVDLPAQVNEGFRVLGTNRPRFTPDSQTVYFSTYTLGTDSDPHSFLYAIDPAFDLPTDQDSDGVADNDDNCPFDANPAQTDSDGDGIGDACDGISDNCTTAVPLCPGTNAANTFGATNDGQATCSPFPTVNRDVWFSYTPMTGGAVTLDTCNSPYTNIYVSVHAGCPGTAANQIACSGSGCASWWGRVTFNAAVGQTYLIRVTGFGSLEVAFNLMLSGPVCGFAELPGDIDGDGDVDDNDQVLFIQVLLGLDTDPAHVARCDLTGDDLANGSDVEPFVEARLPG